MYVPDSASGCNAQSVLGGIHAAETTFEVCAVSHNDGKLVRFTSSLSMMLAHIIMTLFCSPQVGVPVMGLNCI